MQKPTVLFVCPSFQSFVRNDIAILSSEYEVIVNHYSWHKKSLAPWYLFLQFWAVLKTVRKVKFLVVSFGGYWSFWPGVLGKLFRKPVHIILHGTDCASIPEINYGSIRIPLLKWFLKKSYENAALLLPVSESLVYHENTYHQKDKAMVQGFLHYFPDLKTRYHTIPNGLDETFWKPDGNIQKEENSFLSVFSASQFILKGGDLILAIAPKFPNCNFYLAGLEKPESVSEVSSNVYFLDRLDAEQLKVYYSKARFYFQLSIFEGFGCALCEAMLCGCIPIVSNVNQLPAIIQDTGFVLKERNTELLEQILKTALASDQKPRLREAAREQIVSNYTLEKRRQKLLSLLHP